MRTSLALACILAVAGFAAADVTHLEAVNDGTPAGYTGMTRYLVYLVAEQGNYIGGLDGRFDGPMHQAWKDMGMVFETPNLQYMTLLGTAAGADSHVMVLPGGPDTDPTTGAEAPGYEVAEDNPNPNASMEGVGTYLGGPSGTFAVAWTEVLTDNLHVAQIVVPDGDVVNFDGNGAYKYDDGQGGWTYGQNPVSLVIPEPATLGLLAVGALGALIRRRR